MTTKAPVGPPICTREPPERRDQKAGDDRGEEAALRGDAAGDGERDRQRQRDDADDTSGDEIRAGTAAGRTS